MGTWARLVSIAALAAGAAIASARPPSPLGVLVVTGGHGFEREPFLQMFRDNADIRFTHAEHEKDGATVYERDDLFAYDVVVLYDMPRTITGAQKARFLELLKRGRGLVVLHHALVSYQDWPDYERVIGGRYPEPDPAKPGLVTEQVGYEHDVEVPVAVAARDHPVTAGLTSFVIRDEIYWGFRVGSDVTPLLTTTHPKSGKPLAWTRTEGTSRVVVIQPGHGSPAFANPDYRRLLAQSIRWASGRTTGSASVQPSLLDPVHLAAVRARVRGGDTALRASVAALEQDARKALALTPPSVMDKSVVPPSGDKHDYLSQAPYWWPDPSKPDGRPYVRKDGRRNPEIARITDHDNLGRLTSAVAALGLSYYFTAHEPYAEHAARLTRVWFLDPATRMNPHLQFGQGIPGINDGRGIGIIETRGLPDLLDGLALLGGSPAWTRQDEAGLQAWMRAYLAWLIDSPHGKAESQNGNNHETYYDVQVAALALYTGQMEIARRTLETSRERIGRQIEPDGRQPRELARTRSFDYSTMNLSGFFALATLGERAGVDLWTYRTPDGRSLRRALDFLVPFATGQRKWTYEQITELRPGAIHGLLRKAAAAWNEPRYRAVAERVGGGSPRLDLTVR